MLGNKLLYGNSAVAWKANKKIMVGSNNANRWDTSKSTPCFALSLIHSGQLLSFAFSFTYSLSRFAAFPFGISVTVCKLHRLLLLAFHFCWLLQLSEKCLSIYYCRIRLFTLGAGEEYSQIFIQMKIQQIFTYLIDMDDVGYAKFLTLKYH